MRIKGGLLIVAFLCSANFAAAEGKSIIVLDASGSMWGQIDGRAKLEIAREALSNVLAGLPAETSLGLMAYGHREKGNCNDIELIVPPGPGTGPAITAAANTMKFLGKTPLTEAVRRAAAELRSTEEKATVILITDGIETCEADPCALGTELEGSGIDFTAHVVGFGLTAEEGKQVACLAQNTGGMYIEAKDAGSLTAALQTTVAAAPASTPTPAPIPKAALVEYNLAPRVFLVKGGPELGSELAPSIEVYAINGDQRGNLIRQQYGTEPSHIDPGTYYLVADRDEAETQIEITLTNEARLTPDLILNAGLLTLRPITEAGGTPDPNASVTLRWNGGETSHYGAELRVLPATTYAAEVRIGQATATLPVTLAPGETKVQDVIVAAGLAVIDTYYTDAAIMEDIGQFVEIFDEKKTLDGTRNSVAGGYGAAQSFTLPPGDYIAVGGKEQAQAEIAFTVKANAQVDVAVVLNAGVLAMSAPGARGIEIFQAKIDLQGNRKSVRYDYGEATQATLPAGDYIVEAEIDGVMTQAPATVTAGERTEITLP